MVVIVLGIISISGCKNYLSEYKVDDDHYIRIPEDQQERGEYCRSFCSKYTHDPCQIDCGNNRITEQVINSYKKHYGLLTPEENIEFCISIYSDREGQLPQYTNVETRCTVCEGNLNCDRFENEYFFNETSKRYEPI